MKELTNIQERINNFNSATTQIEIDQQAAIKTKMSLECKIEELQKEAKLKSDDLDIVTNAIQILRSVSDESVQVSYKFIEDSLNSALDRIFETTTRKIRLHEYTFGQYPQLEIELEVENGKTRSLKQDSGHGLMQIISLLCTLSLIVITGSRRILVMDEIISGLSAKARNIVNDIMWTFANELGFQFIVCEHGFIPKESNVYHLQMTAGVSRVKENYIEENGIYLDGTSTNDDDDTIQELELFEIN